MEPPSLDGTPIGAKPPPVDIHSDEYFVAEVRRVADDAQADWGYTTLSQPGRRGGEYQQINQHTRACLRRLLAILDAKTGEQPCQPMTTPS